MNLQDYSWEIIDRPARNRRSIHDVNNMRWDTQLEAALLETLEHGRAIKVSLARFHCSPAKGRLWAKGFAVRHRVLPDKWNVAAWVEKEQEEEKEEYYEEQFLI